MVAVAVLATPPQRQTVPMTALLCALYLRLTAVAASRRREVCSSSKLMIYLSPTTPTSNPRATMVAAIRRPF